MHARPSRWSCGIPTIWGSLSDGAALGQPACGKRQGRGAYARLVADSWARARARERIGAVVSEPVDARRLRLQVLAVLREVVDFDAYVWLLTDPVTTVGAAPVADIPCLPELPALIKAKYATDRKSTRLNSSHIPLY